MSLRAMDTIQERRQAAQAVVFAAIDQVNELLPASVKLNKDVDTRLMGESCILDSMGFINFMLAVEGQMEIQCGIQLDLFRNISGVREEEKLLSTTGDLIEHLVTLIDRPIK